MRNIFLSLTAIFIMSLLITLPTQIVFANEESDKLNVEGDKFYDERNYEDAIKKYEAAITIEPNFLYYENLGWAYYNWKKETPTDEDFKKSEENFKKAIDLSKGNDVNAYRGLAWFYQRQGKTDDAKKFFIYAGNKYFDRQNYKESIKDFTEAINLGGGTAEVYDKRGWAYYNLENYGDAFEDFDKIIREIDEKYIDAYKGRAGAYLKKEDEEAAQKDFYQGGVIFYNQDDWHTAILWFNEAVKLGGSETGVYRFSEADSYRLRGWAYHKLNLDDNALTDFSKAIEIFEKVIADKTIPPDEILNCADAYNGRGWVHFAKKNYADAESAFKKSIHYAEDYPYPFRGLAEIYEIQAITEPAKKALAKENYTKAGELFHKRNEFQPAITAFDNAINFDDKDPNLYYLRGLSYSASKNKENLDAALKDFNKAIEIFGKSYDDKSITPDEFSLYVEAYKQRAEVYTRQGNASAATKDLEEAAKIEPPPDSNPLEWLSRKLLGEKNELFEGLIIILAIEFLLTIGRHGIRERDLTGGLAAKRFAVIMIFFIIVFVVDKIQDNLINNELIINATIGMILLWELLLIIDNAERLGVPIPDGLKELLRSIIARIRGFFGVGGSGGAGGNGGTNR